MKNKKAFTLIELLVVIAIIGLIATLSVIALNNARAKSRDAKRAADIKQMQTALELYFNDKGRYPTTEELAGSSIFSTSTNSTTTYMKIIPSAPTPADGDCTSNSNQYVYSSNGNETYTLSYCLGGQAGQLTAGDICATPGGVKNSPCILPCSSSTACGDTCSYSGSNYSSVMIGAQCWFKQNLNVGTMILTSVSQENDSLLEKWCPANIEANCAIYGALYNWAEGMNLPASCNPGDCTSQIGSPYKGLCPDGWHSASDDEYNILFTYLGGTGVAGPKMKVTAGNTPAWDGNNSSGFLAVPSGYRDGFGNTSQLGSYAGFWTTKDTYVGFPNISWYWMVGSGTSDNHAGWASGDTGLSIRCVKD